MKNTLKALGCAAALVLNAQAMADTEWTIGSNCTAQVSSCVQGGLTMTSFKNDGTQAGVISASTLQYYSGGMGVGAYVSGSNTHAVDNAGKTEMIMLNFGTDVRITGLSIGFGTPDTDMTLMAYTNPSGGTPASIVGKTWAQVLAAGWTTVGNYSNVPVVSLSPNPNPISVATTNSLSSSYWLVGAFNQWVGGSNIGGTPTAGDDYMKLASVSTCVPGTTGCGSTTTTTSQVPEPGSLALIGVALAGLAAVRRRKQA